MEPQNEDDHRGNNGSENESRSMGSGARRRISMASMNIIPKKTWGWRIRDGLGTLENKAGPYFKKIFPSFIAVHYFYIIFWVFFGSILIYPVKSVRYIDALFFTSGASTQAGLNTVNLGDMTLYQQIVIYIICCLTTPIFIHGSLCFLRLYWFERYFDDIRSTSKLNFKMRRTATLMARTQSMDRSRTMDSGAGGASQGNRSRPLSRIPTILNQNNNQNNDHDHDHGMTEQSSRTFVPNSPSIPKGDSPETKESDSSSSDAEPAAPLPFTQSSADIYHMNQDNHLLHDQNNNSVEHLSEPSSDDNDEEQSPLPPSLRHVHDPSKNDVEDIDETKTTPNIKFGDLPKPRKHDVEPRDVYMSISMLRNSQQKDTQDEEHEGPALVISGPAEREKPKRQNSAIHFDIQDKPSKQRRRRKLNLRSNRPSISSNFRFNRRRGAGSDGGGGGGNSSYAGDVSTGDEYSESTDHRDIDSILDEDNDHESDHSNNDDHKLQKAQSNLQLPSSDQTGGKKFNKRSNTLDVATNKNSLLSKSPTFEKMIKQRLKPKRIRRRFSSTAIEDSSSSGSDTEPDDEYDDNSLLRHMSTNYLSWNPQIGRNSTFVNLSDQQKEELGGVEYRAIKLLAKILIAYYVGFHILAFIFFVPWIHANKNYQSVVESSGASLTWWGFFTSMSSFNDLGFTLTPNSMSSFNTSNYILLVSGFFIVIGNTGFPVLLRFIIWVLFKCGKELSLFKESLGFLLDHPRRCFTLLFPSAPTWWLLFILIVLNAIDLILFIILDINAEVVDSLPVNIRILDGFYQALSTRTAGFSCINLAELHPGVQVSYLVMMYISVLPLAISIRRTNVYEEQSLGVYGAGHHEHGNDETEEEQKATSFIGAHLRKQLSFDLWFVFMGLFIICISEGGKIRDPNLPEFNIFQVLFEVVSAYGTVGLSLGYSGIDASFSAKFNTISKLVIIAMMIRGRHRGLPYSLDRAIMLPSEKMELRDRYQDIHAGNHLQRAETMGSIGDPVMTFFKNNTPNIIKNHFKKPSFMNGRTQSMRSNRDSNYIYQPQSSYQAQPHQPENHQFQLGGGGDGGGDSSNNISNDISNDIPLAQQQNHPGFKEVQYNPQSTIVNRTNDGIAPTQTVSSSSNSINSNSVSNSNSNSVSNSIESHELQDLDYANIEQGHLHDDINYNNEGDDEESDDDGGDHDDDDDDDDYNIVNPTHDFDATHDFERFKKIGDTEGSDIKRKNSYNSV